jgi:hypothetical protein
MSLSGFEPTMVKGKWFEENNLNHSDTDTPLTLRNNFNTLTRKLKNTCSIIKKLGDNRILNSGLNTI